MGAKRPEKEKLSRQRREEIKNVLSEPFNDPKLDAMRSAVRETLDSFDVAESSESVDTNPTGGQP